MIRRAFNAQEKTSINTIFITLNFIENLINRWKDKETITPHLQNVSIKQRLQMKSDGYIIESREALKQIHILSTLFQQLHETHENQYTRKK